MFLIKIADDWIWTMFLWWQKGPLYHTTAQDTNFQSRFVFSIRIDQIYFWTYI